MKAIANENLTGDETSTVHRFELAGLGKGPFRFTGEVTENMWSPCAGVAPKPGGHCDYCFTGIRYEFHIVSADGKCSKVGSNCIHKTGDRGLIQQIAKAERKLRDAKNAAAKARKLERLNARIAAARATLPTVAGTLASKPHPSKWFADAGNTLLDYVNWCLGNRAGEKAAFIIEGAAKNQAAT